MTTTSIADPNQLVTLGIDTHAEVHAVAALDERGRLLDSTTIPTSPAGFQALLEWAAGFGTIDRIGIEGTGVARWLRAQGLVVIEVDRPDRGERRRRGKSDPIDAEIAARAVQSGRASGTPKTGDGRVEAIRALRIAGGSALDARSRVANQLHALRVTAPDELREELRGLSLARLSLRASRFRVPTVVDTPLAATRMALRSLAQRFRQVSTEIAQLDVQLGRLVAQAAPQLVARPGIGTQIAGNCWSRPAITRRGCAAKAPSPCWSGRHRSRHRQGRPSASVSTVVATARPTPRSTCWR